jgi:hypothetical protein
VSVFVDVIKEVLFRNRDRHVNPVLDGPMRPNSGLDESLVLTEAIPSPDDVAVSIDGAAWVTSGNSVYRFAKTDFANAPARIEFARPVTALASNPEGGVAVAMPGLGVVLVGGNGKQRLLQFDGSASLDCPTALTFGPDGALFVCEGSRDNPPDRWVHDLMQKRGSGRVLRIDPQSGGTTVVAEGLRWPHGLCLASDRSYLVVTEAWSHSILRLPFQRTNERPQRLAENLPGYPARIIPFGSGYCVAYFALRTQLVDFVLSEDSYRRKMIERIEPAFWIAPSLRSEGHYLEPVQGGGLRKHGSVNAWAPPRSYGLVVIVDEDFEPMASFHSRVGGLCHGVTGLASENAQSVIVAAKGASKIIQISTERLQ